MGKPKSGTWNLSLTAPEQIPRCPVSFRSPVSTFKTQASQDTKAPLQIMWRTAGSTSAAASMGLQDALQSKQVAYFFYILLFVELNIEILRKRELMCFC